MTEKLLTVTLNANTKTNSFIMIILLKASYLVYLSSSGGIRHLDLKYCCQKICFNRDDDNCYVVKEH